MDLIERMARTLCVSLNVNPDELIQHPDQKQEQEIAPDKAKNRDFNLVPRWRLVTPGVRLMVEDLRDNPSQSMIDAANMGLNKTKRLVTSQSQVALRYMLNDLLELYTSPSPFPSSTSAPITPVLQSWTGTIPRRQQGVLILALRGPDGCYKEHPCKEIIRHMRGCVMNSGREGKPMAIGQSYDTDSFMTMRFIEHANDWKTLCMDQFFSRFDEYNTHFLSHFLHAAEVLGYKHPDFMIRERWLTFYRTACHKQHINPETRSQFEDRLRDGLRDEDIDPQGASA